MSYDLFYSNKNTPNKYEYNLKNLKKVDSLLICYNELNIIKPDMKLLSGIFIDDNDNIYLCGQNKLSIYDNKLTKLKDFSFNGKAICLSVSKTGNIFLGMRKHIEILDTSGNLIKKWKPINKTAFITSIVIRDSMVFVADAGNKIVHCFDQNGKFIRYIGKKNKEKKIKGFFIPSPYFDMQNGRNGELWVVDPGRHTFIAFNQKGDIISSWKKSSMQLDGFSGCCNPSNFALLSDGSFVTSEKGIERVKIHNQSGEFKCVVAPPNYFEKGTKGIDIAVNSKDQIFITDTKKNIVRIFAKK